MDPRRLITACVLGIAVASPSGCNAFAPVTGAPSASCGATSASAATGPYGLYGGTSATTTPCPEGGTTSATTDAGVIGNVLIADQGNNRVLVVARAGTLLWSFGDGTTTPGPTSIVAPNDAELLPPGGSRMDKEVLTVGTGTSASADNRVIIVDYTTKAIVWTFTGSEGGSDAGDVCSGPLSGPTSAVLVPTASDDHILVTDQGNSRVLEVDRGTSSVVWCYPPENASATETLTLPQSAERLASGNTLIADQGGNRVVEVAADGHAVWQYPTVVDTAALNSPAFASRLPDGNTLIVDSNNGRVLEVDHDTPASVVWAYATGTHATSGKPIPTGAVRLANMHTLVTDLSTDQVLEIDHTPQQNVVYTYGQLGVAGSASGQLNQPYNAKVVTDTTGLTSPLLDASTSP